MAGKGSCRLIVGLGNPGGEYAGTRHNAGFEVVDRFLARHVKAFRERNARSGEAREGSFAGEKLIVLKPLTFMNLSGNAVLPVVKGESLKPSEILVIYDDIDLPVGRMRLRKNGGSAGHNGMKSIIQMLGTENFPRIRIGIGRPAHIGDEINYVIGAIPEEEIPKLDEGTEKAKEIVIEILKNGIDSAMNKFN